MSSIFNSKYGRPDDLENLKTFPDFGIKDGEGYYTENPCAPFTDSKDNRNLKDVMASFKSSKFGSNERSQNLKKIFSLFNFNEEKTRSFLRRYSSYSLLDANTKNGDYRSLFIQIPKTNFYIDLFNLDGSNPKGRGQADLLAVRKLLYAIDFDDSNSLDEALGKLRKKYAVIKKDNINLSRDASFIDALGHSYVIFNCKQQPINIYKDSETNDLLVPVHGGFIRLIDYTPARFRMLHLIPSSLNGMFFIPEDNVNATYFDSYTRKTLRKIASEQRKNL